MGSKGFWRALVFQGLIPVLCSHCKVPLEATNEYTAILDPLTKERISAARTKYENGSGQVYVKGPGCSACNNKIPGYQGREVCASLVIPDEKLLELFENVNMSAADKYLQSLMTFPINPHKNFTGLNVIHHAAYKMFEGIVSPFDVERFFGYIE